MNGLQSRFLTLCVLALYGLLVHAAGTTTAPMGGKGYRWQDGRFAVPLEIEDNAGVARQRWPVRAGVPLPQGLVQEPGELRLVDDHGSEVPSQIAVTSRWWGQDGTLRWVLLDFAVDLPAHGRTQVWLTNDRPAAAVEDPLHIEETDTTITVTTAGLRATVSRRTGQLLQSVELEGHRVIDATRQDGPMLRSGAVTQWEHLSGPKWNNAGWNKEHALERHPVAEAEYLAGPFRPRAVEIESRGPLHAVIAVHARHRPMLEGDGIIAEGLYDTTTRLHFYRGQRYIAVEHTLAHTDSASPRWMYMFRGAGLSVGLALAPAVELTIGGSDDPSRLPAPTALTLLGEQQAWFYQHAAPTGQAPRYAFGTRDPLGGHAVGGGHFGRYVDVADTHAGVTVAVRNFWRDAPRAVVATHDRLQIWLHADASDEADPSPGQRPHYDLDFGERSTHEVLLYFHRADEPRSRAADVAEAFEYPLFARSVPSWYSDCEVWPFEIGRGDFDAGGAPDPHWVAGNERWDHRLRRIDYNSGGHHASLSSRWLPYLRRGSLTDLERLLAESQWIVTHNPGWAYRDVELDDGKAGHADAAHDEFMARWRDLAGFGPKDLYLWRSDGSQGGGAVTYLNSYKALPDAEHYALFQLFEYWYLTGDRRAWPAIHGFVDWAIWYQHEHLFKGEVAGLETVDLFEHDPDALRRGHYSRVYAWMLSATLEGYAATGNGQHRAYALWQLRRMLTLLRMRHGQADRWDIKPSEYLPFLRRVDALAKLDDLFEHRELLNWDSRLRRLTASFSDGEPPRSWSKTWMEAKTVFALHQAYRLFGDERILDGLWGLADYFSHHVVFYPALGMINQYTAMPNVQLGTVPESLAPQRHDRVTQVWPVLFHYTGWPAVAERYAAFTRERKRVGLNENFEQTYLWETDNRRKHSNEPPAAVTDLKVDAVGPDGIKLTWTSPRDDGPAGHAARYFVKYSDKPLRDFAPTDDPVRAPEKTRVVGEVEAGVLASAAGRQPLLNVESRSLRIGRPESLHAGLLAPDWDNVDAFWMAEHVDGEPPPAPAGSTERFTVTALRPHAWLGAPTQPGLELLETGKTYYFAVCSWDADRNLSPMSNVVTVTAP